jgi:Concanavalin A-like lectin/glucanases superfamily
VAVRGAAQTATAVPYRAAVTATGPLAHWPLDGGAGSDIAGSHPLVAGGSGSPSPFGGGVAVADGVAIGSTVLTRSTSASTAVWAKFPSAGTYRDGNIFETGGWAWSLRADGLGGTFVLRTEYDTAIAGFSFPYSVHDDRWHFFVVLNDSVPGFNNPSRARVYLDGQFLASLDVTYGGPPKLVGNSYGYTVNGGAHGAGVFDEAAVWDRALTTAEVSGLWASAFAADACPATDSPLRTAVLADGAKRVWIPSATAPLSTETVGPVAEVSGACAPLFRPSNVGLTTGLVDRAVVLPGGPVTVINASDAVLDSTNNTFEMYVRFPSSGTFTDGVFLANGGSWSLGLSADGKQLFSDYSVPYFNGRFTYGVPASLHDDVWHQIVYVAGPASVNVYLDGQELPGAASTGGRGLISTGTKVLNGHGPIDVSAMVWFNNLQSSDQIRSHWRAALANLCAPVSTPMDAAGYWSLAGVFDRVATSDASGNCRDAAVATDAVVVAGAVGSGVGRVTAGPAVFVSDGFLATTRTYQWQIQIPTTNSVVTPLLRSGGSRIEVDLGADQRSLRLRSIACDYGATNVGVSLPNVLNDGNWHRIILRIDFAGETSSLNVDGQTFNTPGGVYRFCNLGTGSGTRFFTAAGGAVDQIAMYSRVLSDAEINAPTSPACWENTPQTEPGVLVCGLVEGLSVKGVSSGKFLAPVNREASTSSLGLSSNSYAWSVDGVGANWLLDARSLAVSRCVKSPTGPTSSGEFTAPASFGVGFCGDLLMHRMTQVGAGRSSLTRINDTVMFRNWNEVLPASDTTKSSCIEEFEGSVRWAYCGYKAFERGKLSFEFDKPVDTKMYADIVSNPAAPQIAAAGKLFTRSSAAGSGSLVRVPISRTTAVVLLATAEHNFGLGANDGAIFVPGTTSFVDANGVRKWRAPYGVFAVNQAASSTPLGGPGNDVAFAALSRQLIPANKEFSDSEVPFLIDQALRLTTGAQASALLTVLSVPRVRLFGQLPGRNRLRDGFFVGYPIGLFSGTKMMLNADSVGTRTVNSAEVITFRGGITGGASGGPMYLNGELAGVYVESAQTVNGGPALLEIINPLRPQHKRLLDEAVCLAQQQSRTCRS